MTLLKSIEFNGLGLYRDQYIYGFLSGTLDLVYLIFALSFQFLLQFQDKQYHRTLHDW